MVPDPIIRLLGKETNEFDAIEPTLEPLIIPRKNDVLFGKGTAINTHPGNQCFRSVVDSFKPKFAQTKRASKRSVAAEVVDEIRSNRGGRFLVEIPSNASTSNLSSKACNEDENDVHPTILLKVWACAENNVIMTKVMHRLREKSKSNQDQQQQPAQVKSARSSKKKKAGSNTNSIKGQESVGSQQDIYDSVQQVKTKEDTSSASPETSGQSFRFDNTNEPDSAETPGSQVDTTGDLVTDEKEISFILEDSNFSELDALGDLDSFFDHLPEIEEDGTAAGEHHEQEQEGMQCESEDNSKPDMLSDTAQNLQLVSSSLIMDGLGGDLDVLIDPVIHDIEEDGATAVAGEQHEEKQQGMEHESVSNGTSNFLPITQHDSKEGSVHLYDAAIPGMESSSLIMDGLGGDLDSYQHDVLIDPRIHEGTLWQWIERFRSKFDGDVVGYIEAALLVAARLTECLIEADEEEKETCEANPIPLASIKASNVLIRTSTVDSPTGDGSGSRQMVEVIDYVSILSCIGDDVAAGDPMQRLVALGLLFYNLFTGEETSLEAESINLLSFNFINLNNEDKASHRPKKKSQRNQDVFSKCMIKLKCTGVPWSIYELVRNLLGCSQGDSRSDDAYSCISDVLKDLQLMLGDPSRFLHDLKTNPLPLLTIPDKLYGREFETEKVERSYRGSESGRVNPLIITGKSGVGKSKLSMHVQELAKKSSGYFIRAKYDQNNDDRPLAALGTLFNSLCDLFARDANEDQLKAVNKMLEGALGAQAGLLLGMLPSLQKILPSCQGLSHSNCVNSSMSIQFLLGEVLRVISTHSSCHISILLDDLQWADPLSLLVIGSLITSNEESKRVVFFTCTYRDDEVEGNVPFEKWLSSMSALSMEMINLENISVEGVNKLLSETFHSSPRITRPLSSALHHKAGGGNPLFLRQLIASLEKKGFIYVDLACRRWAWDIDRISDLAISDDVVSLLIEEMERLTSDQQLGLTIASCLGSSAKKSIIDILSKDMGHNIHNILSQLTEKGFMNFVDDNYRFAHDKIQQAAYERVPDEQRRRDHMRYGLAICAHTLNTGVDNDEIFFASVFQMNKGGKDVLSDPGERDMVARLNLKAGKRSADLSDMNTAFSLFRNGIGFLGDDHWQSNYELSLNLFDSASNTACALNNSAALNGYTEELLSNARTTEDKLNCMHVVAKSLVQKGLLKRAVEASFKLLLMLGEEQPRRLNPELNTEINKINSLLQDTTDETLLAIPETDDKRLVILMKTFNILGHTFHFIEPGLFAGAILRTVALTLEFGVCVATPLAFAFWGEFLVSRGNFDLGIRLGRIALKLSERKGLLMHKSQVFVVVYSYVQWASSPFQSIAQAHIIGLKAGQQCGDANATYTNSIANLSANYVAGESLNGLRKNCQEAAMKGLQSNIGYASVFCLLHTQICVLTEGLHMLDARVIDNIPGVKESLTKGGKTQVLSIQHIVHTVVWSFLFRQFGDMASNVGSLSNLISEEKIQTLRPLILFGLFFEGLVSFQHARQTTGQESYQWMEKGQEVFKRMQCWSDQCAWNFENKALILQAELMSILGERDKAESLYIDSIKSARDHKFVHEEALSCELAGDFFYETGLHQKSQSFFAHAITCYKRWGALAVAKRLETSVLRKFGSDLAHLAHTDEVLGLYSVTPKATSKKRQGQDDY